MEKRVWKHFFFVSEIGDAIGWCFTCDETRVAILQEFLIWMIFLNKIKSHEKCSRTLCVVFERGQVKFAQCIGTALFCSHYSLCDLTPLICLKIRARKVKNYRVSILIEYCLRTKLDFVCPATLKTAKSVLNALWKLKHNLLESLTNVGCARHTFLWPLRWTLEKKFGSCRTSCLNEVS